MPRLYIAVSGDLSPGLAAAQAVHAALQFSHRHPDIVGPWIRDSQYVVIVAVPDEVALIALAGQALDLGLVIETFHEPDLGDRATAIAIEPGALSRSLCKMLPLLGKELALTG